MKTETTLMAALAIAALSPGLAFADLILDPGTPPLTGTSAAVLNSSDWYAEEFSVSAGETITQLSAFLTQGIGNPNDTFTFDLYSASGTFLGASNGTREAVTDAATGTFAANGWNSVSVNWSNLTAGNYWLAVEVTSTQQTRGLDLPTESSASAASATASPLAYAFAGTNHQFATTGAPPDVGLQVTAASPVPLPAAGWLLGSGIVALIGAARRRRS
jgi:hypothetical protein